MADPYQLLGVPRTADEAAVKKAYRKLAKELHPDRNKDNPRASERFAQITQAYDLLNDKDKRARFDRGEIDGDGNPTAPFGFGAGGASSAGGFRPGASNFEFSSGGDADVADMFEGLFGGRRGGGFSSGFGGFTRPKPKGANRAYRVSVPFVDAATLAPQRVTLTEGKTIDLKLPPGLESGTQMRLNGFGDPGAGGAGDAIVTIEVAPHRFFTRDGSDIRLNLPITLVEAVKGGSIKVPTVENPVMLTIPKGSTSGKVLRLRGKGFHRKDGVRGDQLITLMVDVPATDAALTQFVEHWPGGGNPRADMGV